MTHEFRFAGGCRDGQVYRSYTNDESEREEASRLWQEFGGAAEGVKRPILTPEVAQLLQAGKQKDLARLKEHAHTYQVVSHTTEQGIKIIRCQQIEEVELG